MGQVTFGGPIFNVVSLKCIGKRQKKTFTKSLGGGSWPPCPPWLRHWIYHQENLDLEWGGAPNLSGPDLGRMWIGAVRSASLSVTHVAEHLIEFITSSLDS